ncbi:MAG: hypothetical protein JNM20_11040 [Rhizobiales bacterium]|nr:hypothetical protein [Hyphomicrobiales bacterium]
MAEILLRNLEDDILTRLKARAKAKKRSVEDEAREIITDALKPQATGRPSLAPLLS